MFWMAEGEWPHVGLNCGDHVLRTEGTQFPVKQLFLHPGPNNEYAVIRWRAPRGGTITLAGSFTGLSGYDGAKRTTTDVIILYKDRELLSSRLNLDGQENTAAFDAKATVRDGEVIDFIVGTGDGSYLGDTTALDATITYAK